MRESTSLETIKSFAEELECFIERWYLFNWGEPLIHRDSAAIIDYLATKNFHIKLSTNFSIKASEELIESLAKASNFEIRIDVDGGDAQTHESYRRGSSFSQVIDNCKNLSAAIRNSGNKSADVFLGTLDFGLDSESKQYLIKLANNLGFKNRFYSDPLDRDKPPTINLSNYDQRFGCSWLQSVLCVSPSGSSIAPCCNVWDAKYLEKYESESNLPLVATNTWQSSKIFQKRRKLSNKLRGIGKEKFERWMTNNTKKEKGMALNQNSLKGDICENCTMGAAYQQQMSSIVHGGLESLSMLSKHNDEAIKLHLEFVKTQKKSKLYRPAFSMLERLNKKLTSSPRDRNEADYQELLEFLTGVSTLELD